MANKFNVGIIGCGNIFATYVEGIKPFSNLNLLACADMDVERAKARAKEFGLSHGGSVEELLASKDIQIVVNLTVPRAHAAINLKILQAGKHAYAEKPFALNRSEGQQVVDEARLRQLYVGCAPDTFLGAGIQTARRVIDEGTIGAPIGGTAFIMTHGPENWHPNPEFFYKPGGGPMFDMGPYYVTTLINLIGPVKRVTGSARKSFAKRTITSEELNGTIIEVDVPTHYVAVLDFVNGAVVTLIASFDVWSHTLPPIQIFGTEGSLQVPDPNRFDGKVIARRGRGEEWHEVAPKHAVDVGRGIGVADMASAISSGRPGRASGDLAFHVLDVMTAVEESSNSGRHIELKTTCARPTALPTGLKPGAID